MSRFRVKLWGKLLSGVLSGVLLFSAIGGVASADTTSNTTTASTVEQTRFLQMYAQIKDPASGYFSAEGIPYHAVETLMSEAPDYGHMTTSEAYSYWMWLEVLYGYYTSDWGKLEDAWDNMEKYIIPVNEDGNNEQPTMGNYNPNSPATYASEFPQPDMYPSPLNGQYAAGRDPLDAELKSTYGNNETYLMHWLVDVDNWYGYGNLLNPSHTATYVNTFQRGEQESVWEAIPHPSQDDKTFGKAGEGFMSLYTKENQVPAAQWRYTNATDAEARAIQAMYWAKELGYNNQVYLDKAKKMGDYLRYGMYDKYFQKIGSSSSGNPIAGTGKDASHYLMAWYTSWGGGLGQSGNWAWRIGASHVHQGYQNVLAAYALSDGGMSPQSATAGQDWGTSLKRQLEFYTWLQSAEGAIAGGATNSWEGAYKAYPAGKSTFYGMAYDEAPVYHDPPSNNWFGMQAWGVERIAELYYALAVQGDTSSENFQMAKQVVTNWVDWSMDYVFANSRPVTDSEGYYLNAQNNRILGGTNPQVATTSAPGEFWLPSNLEWSGQPNTWNGFASHTGNAGLKAVTKNPGQDAGVLGSYIKALVFFAAATEQENGSYTALGQQAKTLSKDLLDVAWNYNDGIGIVTEEAREDYFRYFEKEIYIPSGWSGVTGQGNIIPGNAGVPSDPSKGGNGVYIGYSDLRPNIVNDPQWQYLVDKYNTSYNKQTKQWDNGAPVFTYHRFWSQVDMATAYAEYDRLINGGGGGPIQPVAPSAPVNVQAQAGNSQVVLSWSQPSGAVSYIVERSTTAGGPYTTVGTPSTTSFTDSAVTNGTTYYYVVRAVNAAGTSPNSVEVSATPTATPLPSGLAVQYRTSDTNPLDNTIRFQLRVVNQGTTAIDLKDLKIRYYYTKEAPSQGQQFFIDYAQVGSSNVSGAFGTISPAVTGADSYVEIGFGTGAGSLAPGADTGDIQVRLHNADWSNYNENNDYSYNGTQSNYANWNKITAYYNGVLTWGIEP